MTKEERQLVLQDICARLPYKTYIEIVDEDGNIRDEVELAIQGIVTVRYDESTSIRPYLRPMSSMTDEERKQYHEMLTKYDVSCFVSRLGGKVFDWLLSHHFDYRGLIPMGLALEAPADMYKAE